MQRASDKHSPRLDDAMSKETAANVSSVGESHVEEWRQAEPSGEDEPLTGQDPTGLRHGGVPDGMTEQDVEERSELAAHLNRSTFPAVREVLIQEAMDQQAPVRLVDGLRRLPSGREFRNVGDVWSALGRGEESHRF